MDQIIPDQIIQFIKENLYWIVPVFAATLLVLLARIIKFKTIQYQKGSGKNSKNIQIGNDVLIHSKKSRKNGQKNN